MTRARSAFFVALLLGGATLVSCSSASDEIVGRVQQRLWLASIAIPAFAVAPEPGSPAARKIPDAASALRHRVWDTRHTLEEENETRLLSIVDGARDVGDGKAVLVDGLVVGFGPNAAYGTTWLKPPVDCAARFLYTSDAPTFWAPMTPVFDLGQHAFNDLGDGGVDAMPLGPRFGDDQSLLEWDQWRLSFPSNPTQPDRNIWIAADAPAMISLAVANRLAASFVFAKATHIRLDVDDHPPDDLRANHRVVVDYCRTYQTTLYRPPIACDDSRKFTVRATAAFVDLGLGGNDDEFFDHAHLLRASGPPAGDLMNQDWPTTSPPPSNEQLARFQTIGAMHFAHAVSYNVSHVAPEPPTFYEEIEGKTFAVWGAGATSAWIAEMLGPNFLPNVVGPGGGSTNGAAHVVWVGTTDAFNATDGFSFPTAGLGVEPVAELGDDPKYSELTPGRLRRLGNVHKWDASAVLDGQERLLRAYIYGRDPKDGFIVPPTTDGGKSTVWLWAPTPGQWVSFQVDTVISGVPNTVVIGQVLDLGGTRVVWDQKDDSTPTEKAKEYWFPFASIDGKPVLFASGRTAAQLGDPARGPLGANSRYNDFVARRLTPDPAMQVIPYEQRTPDGFGFVGPSVREAFKAMAAVFPPTPH